MVLIMPSVFTKEEVYQHRTQGNIWVAIKDKVYDVTGFIEDVRSYSMQSSFLS